MGFPSKEEIERVAEELKDKEGMLVIDYETSSKSDVLKHRICQEFLKYLKEEDISQAELSRRLNVDKAIANKIILHRIDVFTVDRLLDLISKIKDIEIFLKAS